MGMGHKNTTVFAHGTTVVGMRIFGPDQPLSSVIPPSINVEKSKAGCQEVSPPHTQSQGSSIAVHSQA
jgi:hypothetical protein